MSVIIVACHHPALLHGCFFVSILFGTSIPTSCNILNELDLYIEVSMMCNYSSVSDLIECLLVYKSTQIFCVSKSCPI